MNGRWLDQLLPAYSALHRARGLSLLCVQENVVAGERTHADHIGRGLGAQYKSVVLSEMPRLAVVFDSEQLRPADAFSIPLPHLARLPLLARFYVASREPERRAAQVVVFQNHHGGPFAVVNFHLDTAGDNAHRARQVACLFAELERRRLGRRFIACGDTNAFTWTRRQSDRALATILAPCAERGALDPEKDDTHFFARAHEPKWGQRAAVFLGRLGLDMPRRYDVICTDLPVAARGQCSTPHSDHDLVWADVAA